MLVQDESAHMPKAPDAIVEMSSVMTLWHYNLANSQGIAHQDIIDIVRDAEDGVQS
jgi:hypothetical protein